MNSFLHVSSPQVDFPKRKYYFEVIFGNNSLGCKCTGGIATLFQYCRLFRETKYYIVLQQNRSNSIL